MRRMFGILLATCVIVGFQQFIWADETATPADPVRAHLDNAKTIHTNARQQAADALRAACDAAVTSANSSNQADLAAQLKSQVAAFSAGGALPSLPVAKPAVDIYREAIHLADANLERAYDRAIRHYASQDDYQKALAVEREKTSLRQQLAAGNAPSAPEEVANHTGVAQTLSQAKARYRTDVNEAQQTLLGKVDSRLNDATNAGDLPAVQALQAIEDALKAGGQVPDSATDPAVGVAAANYHRAIQSANVRMAAAFSQAVHDYTRARQIDQAEAAQTEFVSTGLSSINLTALPAGNGVSPDDTTYVLGRRLPDFLTTTDHWDMRPRGIFLQRRAFIRSKSGDYLNRDFTCDLWFTTESTGTNIFIGIGNGRGRPTDGVPINSLALCIISPDNGNGAVGFLRADGEIDPIGRLDAAGDYVARIQGVGNVLSLSIGDEDADGTFNPRISTTVSDASVLAPFMTAHNAHLFFGGGRFWKVRYINGKPPAVIPATVVKSLVGA